MANEQILRLRENLRDSYLTFLDNVPEEQNGLDVVQEARWRNERRDAMVTVRHDFARFGNVALFHELSMMTEYDGGYGVTRMFMGYRSGIIFGVARGIDHEEAVLNWFPGIPVARVNRPLVEDYQSAINEFQRGRAYA